MSLKANQAIHVPPPPPTQARLRATLQTAPAKNARCLNVCFWRVRVAPAQANSEAWYGKYVKGSCASVGADGNVAMQGGAY